MRRLILASTSSFRKSLLEKLQLRFSCQAPDIDETPNHDESAEALVQRLAQAKAEKIGSCSGQVIAFYTGLCLHDSNSGKSERICDLFRVHFRPLSDDQIERYLQREQPYQCAGSFMAEGLGISLFKKLEGDDPNTLVGLPLIRLIKLLHRQGIEIP